MRALTLWQPWAGAVAVLGKDVENRTTNLVGSYRGHLAIHGGQRWDTEAEVITIPSITDREILRPIARWYQPGVIVAVVRVVDVRAPGACGCSSPWGTADRWHIHLGNRATLPEPVPCTGHQGLWAIPPEVEDRVWLQVARA